MRSASENIVRAAQLFQVCQALKLWGVYYLQGHRVQPEVVVDWVIEELSIQIEALDCCEKATILYLECKSGSFKGQGEHRSEEPQ